VNWNILVTKRKEIKKDFVSSGEWKQIKNEALWLLFKMILNIKYIKPMNIINM